MISEDRLRAVIREELAGHDARLLRVEEAAERLAFSKATVHRLIRAGRLRAVRMAEGSPWRVPEDAIGELIDSLDDNSPGWWHRDR